MDTSSTAMLAVKIYAFGGLAFMTGIMLFALGVWVWTIVIRREWANSPPDLELHPEVSKLFFLFQLYLRLFLAYEKERACSRRTTEA